MLRLPAFWCFLAAGAVWGQPQPGHFAYYLMSLSWSPEYCAEPGAAGREASQCGPGRRFAFVLHGLWPQHEPHGWPEDCETPHLPPAALIDSMLDVMPSRQLIRHEWRRHGACSGLTPQQYFDKSRQAFQAFRTPPELQGPRAEIYFRLADLKRKLLGANPDMPERGLVVLCSGRYLREVRVCLEKDLSYRSCPPSIRDRCGTGELIVRPLR